MNKWGTVETHKGERATSTTEKWSVPQEQEINACGDGWISHR